MIRSRFLKDISKIFFSSIVIRIFALPIAIILSINLGPEDYGTYRLLLSIYTFVVLIADLGIQNYIVKTLSEKPNDNKKNSVYLSTTYAIILLLFLIIGIISLILKFTIFSGVIFFNLLLLFLITLPFQLLAGLNIGALNAIKKRTAYAVVNAIYPFIHLILLLGIFTVYLNIEIAIITLIISKISFFIISFLMLYYNNIIISRVSILWKEVKSILSFSIKTLIGKILNSLNYQIDIIMIGIFLQERFVGFYSIAVTISHLFWIFPQSVQTINFSDFTTQYYENNIKNINKKITYSILLSLIILLLPILIMSLFGKDIIQLFFTSAYNSSYLPLNILLIGILVLGSFKPILPVFLSINKVKIYYRIPLISVIINLMLNIILINILGFTGAAIATTISYCIIVLLYTYYLKKVINYKYNIMNIVAIFIIYTLIIILNYYLSSLSITSRSGIIILESILSFFIIFYLIKKYNLLDQIKNILNLRAFS